MGHYYAWDADGSVVPFYDILNKDGSGLRPVTIKDVRERRAVPSVNEILSIQANPPLVEWLINEAFEFAFTNGFWTNKVDRGQPDDAAIGAELDRLKKEYAKIREADAERGTQLHDLVWEKGIRDGEKLDDQIAQKIVDGILALGYKVINVEKSYASRRLGYGGRIDGEAIHPVVGEVILDLKTVNKKRSVYAKEYCQLFGYKKLLNEEYGRGVKDGHLIYASRETGDILRVSSTGEKELEAAEIFDASLRLWSACKHYDPRAA